MTTLHQRVFDIYDCVEKYRKEFGQSPSQNEIGIALNIDDTTVSKALKKMETLGMIKRPGERKVRAIMLVTRQPNWDALMEQA